MVSFLYSLKRRNESKMARQNTAAAAKTKAVDRCGVFSTDEQRVQKARDSMPSTEMTESIAVAFKALSHPSRIRILRALSDGELCVCEISEVVGLSVSATSHQLSLLKGQRLLRSRTEGKQVHYSLSDRFVLSLLDDCARHLGEEGTL